MTRLRLREYDQQAARLAQFVLSHERAGATPVHSVPPSGAVIMRFSDNSGFSVLVDLRAWCGERHPSLARLAADYLGAEEIRDWFHYGNEICELLKPTGAVVSLTNSEPVAVHPGSPLPEVTTSLGRGWLVSAADERVTEATFYPNQLSFRLSMVLGESALRQRYVNRIECGDVLVITRFVEEVRCADYRIGSYQLEEDVIMFEDYAEETPAEEGIMVPQGEDGYPRHQGLSNMPVRLEFVVHEKTVTLGELQQLSRGTVFGTPAHGKDSIMIRANGALIGRGELIWVEDKLCVEVQSLLSGLPDGK